MSTVAFKEHSVPLAGLAVAGALLAVACYAYLRLGAYIDHIEGAVVVSAWEYAASGIPLYQLRDGLPRLATYYGPLAYLAEALPLAAFGAKIVVGKLASMLAVAATLFILGKHFLTRGGSAASSGLFYLVAGMTLFVPVSFWVRPDPFETLLVAAGVALAATPAALGLCIGLAVNFKIHAFVYFFPLLIDILVARQWRSFLLIAAAASISFALPFLAPGISLYDYLSGLLSQIGGRHPSGTEIASVLVTALVLALPLLYPLLTQAQVGRDRTYALAAIVTLLVLIYPATFPGAGPYHFLPLIPVLADALSRLKPRAWVAGITTLPLLLLGFLATLSVSHGMAARRGWDLIAADALALARQAPTRAVQIGYGETSRSYHIAEFSRAVLTLNGFPARVDAQVLMELSPIGIDGSRRWVAALTRCDIQRWLLPKGQKPFALRNLFYGLGPVFDADFRRTFLNHYRLTASDRYFDIWDCAVPNKEPSAAN